MKHTFMEKAAQLVKSHREHKRRSRILAGMMALVMLSTSYMLILPAITLSDDTVCGLAEHSHTESCYELRLVCQKPRDGGHTHTDACYPAAEIVCGQPESAGHAHSAACYTPEQSLSCTVEESAGHVHTDVCRGETPTEPACGLEESTSAEGSHIHGESCYEKVLICGLEEHIHTDACYEDASDFPEEEAPEGYVSYFYEDNCGISITADAPADAFPGGPVELKAELLDGNSDAHAQAEANLDAAGITRDNFLAIDIHFENAAGEEIEPDTQSGSVHIRLTAEGLIPSDADAYSLEVQHHKAQSNNRRLLAPSGGQGMVEVVAGAGGITVTPGGGEYSDVEAAFPVDSFSTFTLTWKTTGYKLATYCVNSDGDEIGTGYTHTIQSATAVTGIAPEIPGYKFLKAVRSTSPSNAILVNATQVARIRRSNDSTNGVWQYNTSTSGGSWRDITSGGTTYYIYFIYEEIPKSISISDTNLIRNGQLTVDLTYTAPEGTIFAYVWEKKVGNGAWAEVARIKVTGEAYNMAEDGSWLNVALDHGSRATYRVRLASVDGTPQAPELMSEEYIVPYYDALQNGSFEIPECLNGSSYQPYITGGTQGIVWKTTASDNAIELVSVASNKSHNGQTHQALANTWHGISTVPDGTQCAELNANNAGALYQDVLTIPGSTMYWSLMHDARAKNNGNVTGNDTMYVIIAPVDRVKDITTQTQLDGVRSNPSAYGATVRQITTHTSGGWKNYIGEYPVPDDQCLTRYFFMAGATASGNNTIGNHIDKVWFSTEFPPPAPGTANLQVTKTVSGDLSAAQLEALKPKLSFTITYGGTPVTISGSQMTWNGYTGTYAIQQIMVPANSSVSYTVTEDVTNADVEGFQRTSTSGSGSAELTIAGTLMSGATGQVAFTNHYVQQTGNLSITKQVHRTDSVTPDGNTEYTFEISIPIAYAGSYAITYVNTDSPVHGNGSLSFLSANGGTKAVAQIKLFHNETATISGLPAEVTAEITETDTSGYAVSWSGDYISGQNSATITTQPIAGNPRLTCINTTGTLLPHTGGAGTRWFLLPGALFTVSAGGLLLLRRRRRKGEDVAL